ncbi:MAG: hypothetical protein ABIR06_13235 [Cyclobacteriaceae bacterium]
MILKNFQGRLRKKGLLCFLGLTALVIVLMPAMAFSQTTADWTLAAEKDGIQVSYKWADCNGHPRILFQIFNHKAVSLHVDFECKITLKGKNIFIPSLINSVEAISTLTGDCADKPFQSTFIVLPKNSSFEAITITIK